MNEDTLKSIEQIKKHSEVYDKFTQYCSNNCKDIEYPDDRDTCLQCAVWFMLYELDK